MKTVFIRRSRHKNGKNQLLDSNGECETHPVLLDKITKNAGHFGSVSKPRKSSGKATTIARHFPTKNDLRSCVRGDYHPETTLNFSRSAVGKVSTWCGCWAAK